MARSKFGAVKTELHGHRFDSKAEARYYGELLLRVKLGEIQDLALHPTWDLTVNGVKIGRYTADFSYVDCATGEFVVSDVKGYPSRDYLLRKKLMKALHHIEIQEIRR